MIERAGNGCGVVLRNGSRLRGLFIRCGYGHGFFLARTRDLRGVSSSYDMAREGLGIR